jgi:hypothetical protein
MSRSPRLNQSSPPRRFNAARKFQLSSAWPQPSSLLFQSASVYIWADIQAEMLKVISRIRYNCHLIGRKDPRQAENKLGAANTAGQSQVMIGVRDVH